MSTTGQFIVDPFLFFHYNVDMNKNVNISWDCDGVLAAFDERVFDLTGHQPHVLDTQHVLWSSLTKHPNFFATLEPYTDMVNLVLTLKSYNVRQRVITGRPRKDSFPSATQDKINWVKTHLGTDMDVIVCLSCDKQKHMKTNTLDILVDDRIDNVHNWRLAGGVAIHHKTFADTHSQLFTLLNI